MTSIHQQNLQAFQTYHQQLTNYGYTPIYYRALGIHADTPEKAKVRYDTHTYTYQQALLFLQNGYNIGLNLASCPALYIMDWDDPAAYFQQMQASDNRLPVETFVVRTRNGGYQVYYEWATATFTPCTGRVFNVEQKEIGDSKTQNGYVLCPGSYVEPSRIEGFGVYNLINVVKPQLLQLQMLPECWRSQQLRGAKNRETLQQTQQIQPAITPKTNVSVECNSEGKSLSYFREKDPTLNRLCTVAGNSENNYALLGKLYYYKYDFTEARDIVCRYQPRGDRKPWKYSLSSRYLWNSWLRLGGR